MVHSCWFVTRIKRYLYISGLLHLTLWPKWNREVPWIFPGPPGNFHAPWKKNHDTEVSVTPGNFQGPLEISKSPGKIHAIRASVTAWNFPGVIRPLEKTIPLRLSRPPGIFQGAPPCYHLFNWIILLFADKMGSNATKTQKVVSGAEDNSMALFNLQFTMV